MRSRDGSDGSRLWFVGDSLIGTALFARTARAAAASAAFMLAAGLTGFLALEFLGRRRVADVFGCWLRRRHDRRFRASRIVAVELRALMALFAAVAAVANRGLIAVNIGFSAILVKRLGLGPLNGAKNAKIVFCVLKVIFRLHAIAARCRVPGKRLVLVINLLSGAANPDVRTV